ncbi:MAG: hypothetical protein ACKOHG_04230 [Planctomycetia bacterium]
MLAAEAAASAKRVKPLSSRGEAASTARSLWEIAGASDSSRDSIVANTPAACVLIRMDAACLPAAVAGSGANAGRSGREARARCISAVVRPRAATIPRTSLSTGPASQSPSGAAAESSQTSRSQAVTQPGVNSCTVAIAVGSAVVEFASPSRAGS